jgi:hypothetical protein
VERRQSRHFKDASMLVLVIIMSFLAGLLICNAVPHLAAGLVGEAFPTPFAIPAPGNGLSSPVANVVWGWINLFIGVAILPRVGLFSPGMALFNLAWMSFAIGFLVAGVFLARYYTRVRLTML